MSTRPSDYRPPPDSPYVGITLSQHLTVTPSGAPRNKHKVCSCSRLPKLYQNTLKRAITRTSPYEPQLAHSTGLPKPPGYNLEWSRVTPIRVTLVTGPPAKASDHEHHLKLCRNHSSRTITKPKPLVRISRRQANTPPHATRLQHHHCNVTARRTPPRRRAPLAATAWHTYLAPPGATAPSGSLLYHTAWRNSPYR